MSDISEGHYQEYYGDESEDSMGNLTDVKVGDCVWSDVTHNYGTKTRTATHLQKVTHIDKQGRIYFCSDPELKRNWRYGFDPITGKARAYERYQIRYASPEEIEEEHKRAREIEESRKRQVEESNRISRIEGAAVELYEALDRVISIGKRDMTNPKYDGYFEAAREALKKAGRVFPE